MFDHVTVRASDRAATERFYDAVLPALSVDGRHRSEHATLFGNYELSIAQASGQRPVTTGLHLGLRAPSTDAVNGFWELGLAAGYRSDGEPVRDRSTATTTTGPSCSTPTATASRPRSTAARVSAA